MRWRRSSATRWPISASRTPMPFARTDLPEDRSSAGNGDSNESSIWRGLRNLIFGDAHEDTLRGQLEDAIDRHEDDPAPEAKGDQPPHERQTERNLHHL